MITLKTALLVNGISAAVTGAGLIALAPSIATVFGLHQVSPFVYTGIFLLFFGLFVLKTAFSKLISSWALKLISTLDILWIVASTAVIATAGSRLSVIGNILIVVVAVWVGLMAILQQRTRKQRGVASFFQSWL